MSSLPLERNLAYLLLMALVFSVNFVARTATRIPNASDPVLLKPCFVGISGLIKWPGVYSFNSQPSLQELIDKAGGLNKEVSVDLPSLKNQSLCFKNVSLVMSKSGKFNARVEKLDAYKRITLGLRLELNTESQQDLTAVPGIGPKTASAIVWYRKKVGRINSLSQLTLIPGIGPGFLRKISPYVTIKNSREQRSKGK